MQNKDKKYIITKALINIAVIILGAFMVATFLSGAQKERIRNQVEEESINVLNQVEETIKHNREDVEELTDIYHSLNIATVNDVKNLLTSGLFDNLANSSLEQRCDFFEDLCDRAGEPFLFVMDSKGRIVLTPYPEYSGISIAETGWMSSYCLDRMLGMGDDIEYIMDKNEHGHYYFYHVNLGLKQASYYLVLGTDAQVLDKQFASLKDVGRVIENIIVGSDGFLFAVDKNSQNFLYYKDSVAELSGLNALEYGLSEKALNEGYSGVETINGNSYYCVSKDLGQYTIVVAATDVNALTTIGNYALMWSTGGFVVVSLLCLIYASIVRNDYFYNELDSHKIKIGKFGDIDIHFNLSIFKKLMPVMILGVMLIYGISYYSYTILEINSSITDSNVNINELVNNFADSKVTEDVVTKYYEKQFLAKAKLLSYLFESNPNVLNQGDKRNLFAYDEHNNRLAVLDSEGNQLTSVANSKLIDKFAKDNMINSIYIYDEQGRVIATNMSEWYFQLSFNPDEQSYPFRDVLDRKYDYYIQKAGIDETGHNNAQYLGTVFSYYTTKDGKGNTLYVSSYDYNDYLAGNWTGNKITKHDSLIQIGLNLSLMGDILETTDYEYLIQKSAVNNATMVLFDNSDDHIILYAPNQSVIGKPASEIGLNKNTFNGDYIGIQKANGTSYLVDVKYYDGYYICNAVTKTELFTDRNKVSLITAANGFFFILLMSALVTLSNSKEEEIYSEQAERIGEFSDQIMFMISKPTGEKSVTEKAASRWDNKNIPWREKTSEQKLMVIISLVLIIVIVYVLAMMTLIEKGKLENAFLSFIVSGNWDKGWNIFALTACGLILLFINFVVKLLNIPIKLVTSIFGTKSETVGHLLASVLKYTSAIFGFFYCLYMIGFDSTSLLTSAGILSLVVGLGSQSLIKDVVAGIFLIFEGEFRVGDIVTIGNYRGQVLDVGLRTTKIMAADHNIKIINNNDVNGVINMTRVSSLCSIDVAIPYGLDQHLVEEVLISELPKVKEKVEEIIEGPFYNGVSKFDTKTITLTISALCKEKDIMQVKSGMNSAILDIIYHNGLDGSKK